MLILPIVYIGANVYLFWRLWYALSWMPMWGKVVVTMLFWIAAFALFAAIGLRQMPMPEALSRSLFRVGSVWMVFLLYMVMLLVVFDLVKLFLPAMGHTLLYALPIACGLLLYGYINYKHPHVERLDIALDKEMSGSAIKVVAVSDLHLGYGTGLSALNDYVEMINAERPDLILIAGDLIDNSLKPLRQAPFDSLLSELKAPLGIYMVPGNHEYISGMEESEEYLKHTPIALLSDSIVTLPNGVQIIGRDDRSNRKRKSLEDLMSQANPQRPIIVLDHQPYHLAKVDSLGVDIQLSGHTHHGQVWPLSIVTDHLYEQSHGYRKWNNSHIWVSSGLSLWGPPFRIGTNSDMAVMEIHAR